MAEKPGCPRCGKPTAGMPTPEGFKWMYCEECIKLIEAEKGGGDKGSEAGGGKS